jgi:hypothetical protein
VAPDLVFNSLKFEGIRPWVIELLPDIEDEHRPLAFEPLLDERTLTLEISAHVRE